MNTPETTPEPEQDDAARLTHQPDESTIASRGLRIASSPFRARGPVKPEQPPAVRDYGETTGV